MLNSLKNGGNQKTEEDLRNEDDIKSEDDLNNEDDLKNWPIPPKKISVPSPPLEKYLKFLLMTSQRDNHTTIDV